MLVMEGLVDLHRAIQTSASPSLNVSKISKILATKLMVDIIVITSLVAQLVKNPPAMWETLIRSLGRKDPLEKGKATHSSILAWRIP